jgi:pantetheine-phosphate adenylyltransferase
MVNNLIVCGGTFDHFHRGHREFLNYAFSIGKKIIVGLTSDEYVIRSKVKSEKSNLIESYAIRQESLERYLLQKKIQDRVAIFRIDDLFGSTLSKNLLIEGIVVTEESRSGADVINRKRKELGLAPLKIFTFPRVLTEDGGIISSARIRSGEIDREGNPYVKNVWFEKNLKLTKSLRKEFKEPFGELFKNVEDSFKSKNNLVITVGDVTAKNFNTKFPVQNISIIDYKVAREKKFSKLSELGFAGNENIFNVDNPAGYITSGLFKKLAEIIKSDMRRKIVLLVNGEEDLAVLPMVLLSPLETVIYYGQPEQGVMKIVVSGASKNRTYSLISKLKIT